MLPLLILSAPISRPSPSGRTLLNNIKESEGLVASLAHLHGYAVFFDAVLLTNDGQESRLPRLFNRWVGWEAPCVYTVEMINWVQSVYTIHTQERMLTSRFDSRMISCSVVISGYFCVCNVVKIFQQ